MHACWRLCVRPLLKTLWQKKKFILTSNLSLCHNVFNFYIYIILPLSIEILSYFCIKLFKVVYCRFVVCGKGLRWSKLSQYKIKPFPNNWFRSKRLSKTLWQKEKFALNMSKFSFAIPCTYQNVACLICKNIGLRRQLVITDILASVTW